MFAYSFDYSLISEATAVANLGLISLMFGSVISDERINVNEITKTGYIPNQVLILAGYILLFLFLTQVDASMFKEKYTGDAIEGLPGYILLLLASTVLSAIIIEFYNLKINTINGLWGFMRNFSKPLMILVFLILGVFLVSGYRTLALQIMIMTFGLYALMIKPINWKKFLIYISIGLFVMSILTRFRTARDNFDLEKSLSTDIFQVGMDLIISNRSLYLAIGYTENHEYSFGYTMIGNLAAPVPFLQSFLLELFELDPHKITSSKLVTYLTLGGKAPIGLGTNIIADLYFAFGLPGVIFFMFFLGYFINNFRVKGIHGSIYYLACYGILLSYSVYLVRAEYFFFLRLLCWTLVIVNLIKNHPFKITLKGLTRNS